ncbi:MAG: hypothetical protein FWD82_01215 [Defluviitaleaceae bacterium]|nr:hypothetical protein [Defluviitaleaceae bacterium]
MKNILSFLKKSRLSTKLFVISLTLLLISIPILNSTINSNQEFIGQYIIDMQEGLAPDYSSILPSLAAFGFFTLCAIIWSTSLIYMFFRGTKENIIKPLITDIKKLLPPF